VGATLRTPLGDVRAYSVHTETPWLGPQARLDQAGAVLSRAARDDTPTVVAGDFHTSDPGALDATVRLYQSAGFTWASRDSGDTAGSFTLDSTFTKAFETIRSGTVATRASDHRPEFVDATLAQTP
jgi:endonuclease/exonuclease/phosphatase (EEP) superfamily protein YafD